MRKTFIFALAVLFMGTANLYAGCVDTFGIGAKATSMGGAFAAYADDPFAVYYNPAGLSQIEKPTFALGVHIIDPHLEVKGLKIDGTADPNFKDQVFNVKDDFPLLAAPHMGYAMPITDKVAMGIAFYAPWGLEVEWPKNAKTNPAVYDSYHSYYRRIAINPSISYKVNDNLSLGFGVSIGRSESGVEKYIYAYQDKADTIEKLARVQAPLITGQDFDALPTAQQAMIMGAVEQNPELQKAFALHGTHVEGELEDDLNFSFHAGVMFKPIETITLGLTYRSETKADFDGDLKLNGVKVAKVSMDYNHPQQIQAGIRYQPHSRFSMEFDVVWTEWSINSTQNEKLRPGDILGEAIILDRSWKDTRQIRFGAEYVLNDIVTLRGGYFYDPSPIPDKTLDLMWPDANKKTYAFGAGFNLGDFTIDTVLQYTDVEQDREVGGESENLNSSFNGVINNKYNFSTPQVSATARGYLLGAGVTVSYRF